MGRFHLGLVWAISFVGLEAVQAVFFGNIFQAHDAFVVGAWVFGTSAAVALGLAAYRTPNQLRIAWNARGSLIGLNVSTAMVWVSYFLALQMIEPAVVFSVFSGLIPLSILVAGQLGVPEATSVEGRLEWLGLTCVTAALCLLASATLAGWSGFVRGGSEVVAIGLGLSTLSAVSLAAMMIYGKRLDDRGVAPIAQYGLRFPLYVVVAVAAAGLGLDAKPDTVGSPSFPIVLFIGLAVIAFPVFAMQKAVAMLPTMTLATITALGPLVVFVLQFLDERVAYAPATMIGLIVYFGGAVLAAAGTMQPRPAEPGYSEGSPSRKT